MKRGASSLVLLLVACLSNPAAKPTPDAGLPDFDGGTDAGPPDAGGDDGGTSIVSHCPDGTRADAGGPWPPAGVEVVSVLAADLDLDGFDELLVGVAAPVPGLYIIHGAAQGAGLRWAGFLSTAPYTSTRQVVADFNADGCPDVLAVGLVFDGGVDGGVDFDRESFDGFQGTGDVSFPVARKRHERVELGSQRGFQEALTSGFFDGDRRRDLVRARSTGPQLFSFDWSTFTGFTEFEVPGPGNGWGLDQRWESVAALATITATDGGADQLFASARNGVVLFPAGAGFSIAAAEKLEAADTINAPPALVDLDRDGVPELVAPYDTWVLKLRPTPRRYREDATRFSGINHQSLVVDEFDEGGPDLVALRNDPPSPPAGSLRLIHNLTLLEDGGVGGEVDVMNLAAARSPVQVVLGHAGPERRIIVLDTGGAISCLQVINARLTWCQ